MPSLNDDRPADVLNGVLGQIDLPVAAVWFSRFDQMFISFYCLLNNREQRVVCNFIREEDICC